MNIGARIKSFRQEQSGKANVRAAKKLQKLKAIRIKAEGKAKLKKSISKERALIKQHKGANFLDRVKAAGKKVQQAKENKDYKELNKLRREVEIAKLKSKKAKLSGVATKKQIVSIGNGKGGDLF